MQVDATVVLQRRIAYALPYVGAYGVMSQLHGCVMPGATLTAKVYITKQPLNVNEAGTGAAGILLSGVRSCGVPVPRLHCLLR